MISVKVRCIFGSILFLTVAVGLVSWPAQAQTQIHTNGFAGRSTAWIRGEDNVRAEEKAHLISEESAHAGPTSERIQLVCPGGSKDASYANYFYPTPPAPISEELRASVFIKSDRRGIQLSARMILPKEKNPQQPDEPLTVILPGDSSKMVRRWERLTMPRPQELLRDAQQKLRLDLKRDIDITGAYIDRLILNLYTAAGPVDTFIDDLEIGPVLRQSAPPPPSEKRTDSPSSIMTGKSTVKGELSSNSRSVAVKLENNRLTVAGSPFFMRAIRYSGTPLKVLHDIGLNTVWFDVNTPNDTVEEAVNSGFWIVPSLPLANTEVPSVASMPNGGNATLTSRGSDTTTSRDAEGLATALTRFSASDGVLFWDLGGARSFEQLASVTRTASAIRRADPQRPRGADVWDGISSYALQLEMLGTHRTPLMTSMEPMKYRDWLVQRRNLATRNTPNKYMWTWVQTHMPESLSKQLYDRGTENGYTEPIGPHPEQIRILTYLAVASGYQGLGYWSDRFLANSYQGRDRLLMLALLNQELKMLEPILLTLREPPQWIDTSDPRIKAAVLRSQKGVMILPIWVGLSPNPYGRVGDDRHDGTQYVPPAGTARDLSITVPNVPDGTEPWLVSPAQVQSLQQSIRTVEGGKQIRIPQFDMTAAVVFTDDHVGLVAKWQNRSRQIASDAAGWMMDLATVQFEKISKIHEQLDEIAPKVPDALPLLNESSRRLKAARQYAKDGNPMFAYQEAGRSMQALRLLMRAHWEQAIRTLDIASSSPYTVSFYTLPKHWRLANEIRTTSLGANALRDGDFEAVASRPEFQVENDKEADLEKEANPEKETDPAKLPNPKVKKKAPFVPVTTLPGWTVQETSLDEVIMEAQLVSSARAVDKPPVKAIPLKKPLFTPSSSRVPVDPVEFPQPKMGEIILNLEIRPKPKLGVSAKQQTAPEALERTFLAVNTPAVRLPPGTLVRISTWMRVPVGVAASADGAMFFDSVGGESLGVRVDGVLWKEYHLYRRVPPSGIIWATAAITGLGTAQFEDIRIEPLYGKEADPK